ncbi:hypothetical protein J4E93_004534 [Alternaria ventricosa]|uniref:uncharacterized protein n=1 Tax=Alternaria ventricosa TaxID=1187951 RepID=UPI0020C3B31A|nr:uncharacterized protein J4E93_004534 [Alternaria ventricosa]KAI4648123.1 hypothetical protein J4E93_004534 [Alternaria ventricosa]
MELYIPISISKLFLVYFLPLAASIAISALNYAGLAKVPHIVILLASPALLVLQPIWEEALLCELERQSEELRAENTRLRAQTEEMKRQTEELRAKNRRSKAHLMAFEHATEELENESDDLDDEAKILARIEKIKALQEEFRKTFG